MSKQYKVLVTALQGLGKNIHYGNEIVTEDCFDAGHLTELVAKGFLEEVEYEVEASISTEDQTNAAEVDTPAKPEQEEGPSEDAVDLLAAAKNTKK